MSVQLPGSSHFQRISTPLPPRIGRESGYQSHCTTEFTSRDNFFAEALDTTTGTTPTIKTTLKKVKEAKKFLVLEHKASRNPYLSIQALDLATNPSSKSSQSALINALCLEIFNPKRKEQELEKSKAYLEAENTDNAIKTFSHLEEMLSSAEKLESPRPCPLMWDYVQSCLTTRNIQLKITEELLGEGSQGKVFNATLNGKTYALKKPVNKNPSEEEAKLFQEEAKLGLELHHPNIQAPLLVGPNFILYEKAECDFFAFMERIRDNTDLISPENLLEFFEKLAAGYAHMHEQGYLVKDIKMENILVLKDPNTGKWLPRIADLGFACHTDNEEALKEFVYNPLYISKELIQVSDSGNTPDVSLWMSAEVYALCVIIFLILREEGIVSLFVNQGNPYGYFETNAKLIQANRDFGNLTTEYLETLIDPEFRRKLDPHNVLFSIMCDGLKEEYLERPSMASIQAQLAATLNSAKRRRTD